MGILDQVTGALRGSNKGRAAQGAGVHAVLLQQLISYLCKPGALGNLSASFQQHGLSNVLQSWLGSGPNLPISGSQIQQVLGSDVVSDMASKAGLDTAQTADSLARLLPQVVDKVSPDGRAPAPDELGEFLSSVNGKMFG